MTVAINLFTFVIDRMRTIMLALSLIVLFKTAWVLCAPALLGY